MALLRPRDENWAARAVTSTRGSRQLGVTLAQVRSAPSVDELLIPVPSGDASDPER